MFKWKHYVELLYRESKSTCPNLPPRENDVTIQHYVGSLEQIANKYGYCEQLSERIDSCYCLQYKNIRFYVHDNYEGEYKMYIELVDDKSSLFVFENGSWLHGGVWCKQIKDILRAVDKRVTGNKLVLEVIKESKQIAKKMEFKNKWERNNKEVQWEQI